MNLKIVLKKKKLFSLFLSCSPLLSPYLEYETKEVDSPGGVAVEALRHPGVAL